MGYAVSAVRVRALSPGEVTALAGARTNALNAMPYFAAALFALRPVAAEGLGTFAVDKGWRLYVDPETLGEWGPVESGAVLLHEVGHLLRSHAARARALGSRVDHALWNYCADAAINHTLSLARVPLPEGVVLPEHLGQRAGLTEEAYYRALAGSQDAVTLTAAPVEGQDAPGFEGCGSGAGDPAQPWELPTDEPLAPGLSAPEAEMTRRAVAADVRAAAPGTVPGDLARWAEDALTVPTLPWTAVLGRMVGRATRLVAGAVTHTYARPSRHPDRRVVLPARRAPLVRVAAVVDTSGSMSPPDLRDALSEIRGLLSAAGGELTVLTCDVDASRATRVRRAEAVRLTGGGGTDMRVGISAAERSHADVIVVLTDGETPWPARPTRARLVVVLTRKGRGPLSDRFAPPPWATVLTVA